MIGSKAQKCNSLTSLVDNFSYFNILYIAMTSSTGGFGDSGYSVCHARGLRNRYFTSCNLSDTLVILWISCECKQFTFTFTGALLHTIVF